MSVSRRASRSLDSRDGLYSLESAAAFQSFLAVVSFTLSVQRYNRPRLMQLTLDLRLRRRSRPLTVI